MRDDYTVCFCVGCTQGQAKEHIRKMVPLDSEITNALLAKVHTALAGGDQMIGRCLSCVDDLRDLIEDYQAGKWC